MSTWRFAAVYAALSVAFCWPLFAHPMANGTGDWDQHTVYYASVLRNAAFGDLPFWNPWYCGGNVLWANPQASLVSPVYVLALMMPITLAMKVNVLAHYLIGCLGLHLVVRRLIGVMETAPTVLLVSLFVFSGAIALHIGAGHTVYLPVLLLPLLIYCFWTACAGNTRFLILGSAVLGFTILNGGMHVAPLAVVLLVGLGTAAVAVGRTLRPLLVALAMVALGCTYAAPRIVPAVEFIRSAHFHDERPIKAPDFMSMRMLLVSFWDPEQRAVMRRVTPAAHWYGWQEYGNYLGWFGAALVLVSVGWILLFRWRAHWREVSTAMGLILVTLLTAGEFAPYAPAHALRDLPLFSNFRIPSRYTMLVSLTGSLCVAFAARAGQAMPGALKWRRVIALLCVIGVSEIVWVNRTHFESVFILSADTQSRLFDRTTPAVVPQQVVAPGPRPHRTYMLDSMMAGLSTLDCYEPLQLRKTAQPGPVAVRGDGDLTILHHAFSPNQVSATVAVGNAPVRLTLNQNYATGWRSNVGPVTRDPAGRQPSVIVPARYEGPVIFRFVPPGLWSGVVIFAIATVLSVIAWRASPRRDPT